MRLVTFSDYNMVNSKGESNHPPKCRRVIVIVALILFLAITSTMSALIIYTIYRIQQLEMEVDALRVAINDITEDLYVSDLGNQKNQNNDGFVVRKCDFVSEPGDDYNIDYDSDYNNNYDEWKLNETVNNETTSGISNEPITNNVTYRSKRHVIGYTVDGVPINSESYADAIKRNNSLDNNYQQPQFKQLHYPSTPNFQASYHSESDEIEHVTSTPRPIYSRRSRVMHQEDKSKAFRQVVRKSSLLKSGSRNSAESSETTDFTIVRDDQIDARPPIRHRARHHSANMEERHVRVGRIRPLPTAHFNGDTSKYVVGQHSNFNGNGHLRHPQRTFVDWKESDWVNSLGMNQHFTINNGLVTVKDSGLYLVYAQIYYLDEHDTNGFRVYKNNDAFLQCTTMSHSLERVIKGNTCYTAAAEYLAEGDIISLGDLGDGRYSLFEPGKSFFGFVKLGDVRIK